MTNYREIFRLKSLGLNNSQIAESMSIMRQTVITVLKRAEEQGLTYQTVANLSDREIGNRIYPSTAGTRMYAMPDYEWVHREMAKSGVTLYLLWMEYTDKCRQAGLYPYQITQFKKYYQEYLLKTKATMHMQYKPGEIMQVDWVGTTATIIDDETGEVIKAYIFVAVLPYSGYAYAEAFYKMDMESWITGHIHAYGFFSGATRLLVPDNLKTAVTKVTKEEVHINKSYLEMAEHYGTAVLPARVRAPRDKAIVENTVGNVTTYILASIRNERFFSLVELNDLVQDRLRALNSKAFQKREGSRAAVFAEERVYLLPLPPSPFELADWKVATVQINYHITVDGQSYSVPYEYIKRKVDVRLTHRTVEVIYEGNRIASHVRRHGPSGQYSTLIEHMPPKHQEALQWNGDRFRRWATQVGPHTCAIIEMHLSSRKVEQQAYRSCMAILQLSKTHTPQRLEAACAVAMSYSLRPNYKVIQSILVSGRDKVVVEQQTSLDKPSPTGFTRGAEYYGRGRHLC